MEREDRDPRDFTQGYSFTENKADHFAQRTRELFAGFPRDKKTIAEMEIYNAELKKRAEILLASMQAQLFKLHRRLEELMDDAEFDEAIRNHFAEMGAKEDPPWTKKQTEDAIRSAKQCFIQSMHGEVLNNIAFQAAVKNEHHKDVASAIFFSSFFSYLTDPKVRKAAQNRARQILEKEGYSAGQIERMFGEMAPVKINPIMRTARGAFMGGKKKKEQIIGFGLENAGIWSQTWNLIKHSEQNNVRSIIDSLYEKTGIPTNVLGKKVLEVGRCIEMLHGLPSNIGSRLAQQTRNIMEGFTADTDYVINDVSGGTIGIGNKTSQNAPSDQHPQDGQTMQDTSKDGPVGENTGQGEQITQAPLPEPGDKVLYGVFPNDEGPKNPNVDGGPKKSGPGMG